MPKGFRVRALLVASGAMLGIAAAGCASPSRQAPAAAPGAEAADSAGARVYLSLADRREDGADWVGALAVVDKALAQNPGSPALLLRRAQLLMLRANDEDAPALREDARAILAGLGDASDAESRATVAWLDFEDGRRDDALAAVHAAADADPESARLQLILSQLLYRNGDYGGAKRAAERARRVGAALQRGAASARPHAARHRRPRRRREGRARRAARPSRRRRSRARSSPTHYCDRPTRRAPSAR